MELSSGSSTEDKRFQDSQGKSAGEWSDNGRRPQAGGMAWVRVMAGGMAGEGVMAGGMAGDGVMAGGMAGWVCWLVGWQGA